MKKRSKSVLINVEGMKCGGCVQTVEKTILNQANVKGASVNLIKNIALIELINPSISIDPILCALKNRGFPSNERSTITNAINDQSQQNKAWWKQWNQLMISLVLLLLSGLGHLAEGDTLQIPILGTLPFHASLATFAILGPGFTILKNGCKAAINFSPTMDTLVGIGVLSAYLASLNSLIWPNVGWPCFFNEPVMLLGFVLLGRFLEERARFRTSKALGELAQLQPDKARILIKKNQFKEVRVGAIKEGETIQILAGDRIPIDGTVLEGNSSIDISSLTGEPLPQNASPGSEISAGTLNLDGTLIAKANHVGAETALARIICLVEQAQTKKAPIQTLADQIAGKFCYGVIGLSILTFLFWWQVGTSLWPDVLNNSAQGLMHSNDHMLHSSLGAQAQTSLGLAIQLSIAVLVIACPCALGLATPTVITVATGKAAKKGWLFKGGDVIEQAASIKQMIFDKTGTLTIGKPTIAGYLATKNQERLLQIAASIENNSRHPIAYAILQEAELNNLQLLNATNVKTIPGKGIYGELETIKGIIKVGTIEWAKEEGVDWNKELDQQLSNFKCAGQSIVCVSIEKEIHGLIIIDDKIRNDASEALIKLQDLGLQLKIMSGDRRESVIAIGEKLGFKKDQLNWQLLPEDKLKRIESLKSKGAIAMVGDGINDAPALASSDLGISISTGTQIAQESADLVLLGDQLRSLPEALLLAKIAIKKVKQNLFWAFGYNIIALPIAAGILLPNSGILLSPPIAALLMASSSITVVINSLSLRTI